jgi:hypothetical protein
MPDELSPQVASTFRLTMTEGMGPGVPGCVKRAFELM